VILWLTGLSSFRRQDLFVLFGFTFTQYSSLAYMVTCIELTGEGKILASMFFKYTDVFSIVGIVYLILVSIATWILNTVEKQLSIPGFESPRV